MMMGMFSIGELLPDTGHIIWTKNASSAGTARILSSVTNIRQIFVNGESRSVNMNQSLAAGKNTIEIVLSNTNTVPDIFRGYLAGCEVWISESFTRFADYALYATNLSKIHWNPENIISAGRSTFYQSKINFGEAKFPNLSSLGISTFQDVTMAKVLDMGIITRIPEAAFRGTAAYFVIPSTVTQIDNLAFYINNYNIDYKILATVPPILNGTQVFNRAPRSIKVPAESVEAYKAASGWSAYASKITAIPE